MQSSLFLPASFPRSDILLHHVGHYCLGYRLGHQFLLRAPVQMYTRDRIRAIWDESTGGVLYRSVSTLLFPLDFRSIDRRDYTHHSYPFCMAAAYENRAEIRCERDFCTRIFVSRPIHPTQCKKRCNGDSFFGQNHCSEYSTDG